MLRNQGNRTDSLPGERGAERNRKMINLNPPIAKKFHAARALVTTLGSSYMAAPRVVGSGSFWPARDAGEAE
jgi:hypothetical protein